MALALWDVVESLEGRDIEKMSPAAEAQFKADAMSKFREASAVLPALLISGPHELDRFIWSVEPPEFSSEWIGRFSMRTVDLMEANFGQSERLRMAAALFPDVELVVDLMGDFHYPGGMSVFPLLAIALRVTDDPALFAFENTDKALCDELVRLARNSGFEIRVRACEDATDDLIDPDDLSDALIEVAHASRSASDDGIFFESVELKVSLPIASRPSNHSVNLALRLCGTIFTSCAFP
ncbi:MAG: hypothetical protein VB138_14625 [Burkholderia sp.]